MTALTTSWLHVNITDHERSFVTLKDWKLQLLKLWMRIQNRFFRKMTSSCYCSYQQKPLSMSLSCHLEVKKRTATTSHTRWCHSLRKKELERGMKEGEGNAGGVKDKKTGRKYKREGDGDVMFQSSGSSVFVKILSINCRSTLRIKRTDTTELSVWHSHDVIIFNSFFWRRT